MKRIKPQPKLLTLWRIVLALIMCVPAFLNSLLLYRSTSPAWIIGTAVWMIVFFAGYLVYLPLAYRRISFSLYDEKVTLYSGVFYRRIRSIPLENIQFTSLWASPLHLVMGICSLSITAAGGHVTLPGLRKQDAESLAAVLNDHSE